eukprot:7078631-Prymnesium_polylepis.1
MRAAAAAGAPAARAARPLQRARCPQPELGLPSAGRVEQEQGLDRRDHDRSRRIAAALQQVALVRLHTSQRLLGRPARREPAPVRHVAQRGSARLFPRGEGDGGRRSRLRHGELRPAFQQVRAARVRLRRQPGDTAAFQGSVLSSRPVGRRRRGGAC